MSRNLLFANYYIIIFTLSFLLLKSIIIYKRSLNRAVDRLLDFVSFMIFIITVVAWIVWAIAGSTVVFFTLQFTLVSIQLLLKISFVAGSLTTFGVGSFVFLILYRLLKGVRNTRCRFFPFILLFSLGMVMIIFSVRYDFVSQVIAQDTLFVYNSYYRRWQLLFVLFNSGIIFSLLFSYVKLGRRKFSSYLLQNLLLGFLISILWASLWNVFFPSILHTSKFSFMGPLSASIFLYMVWSIWSFNYLDLIIKVIQRIQMLTIRIFIYGFYFIFLHSLLNQIGHSALLPPLFLLGFVITETFISYIVNIQYIGNKLINFANLAPVLSHIGKIPPDDLLKKLLLFLRGDGSLLNDLCFIKQPGGKTIMLSKQYAFVNQFNNIKWNLIKKVDSNIYWAVIDDVVWYRLRITSMHNEKIAYNLLIKPAYGKYIPVYIFLSRYSLSLSTLLFLYEVSSLYATFNQRLERQVKERTAELQHANFRILAAYARLSSLYKALETSDEAKTMFISVVSHQLRTPLSVIRNYVDMLESQLYGKLNPTQLDILKRIKDASTRLTNLVIDVLQSSRLERGKFSFVLSNTVVEDLVKQVVNQYVDMANRRKIKLRLHLAPEVHQVKIKCDKDKLFEAFSNIVDNAIHYTPKGGSVDVYLYKPNEKWIIFAVKDTGIGIPENEKHKLFGKFTRLENAKKIRPDGTGIGLYLVKKIIDGHGGKVWFKSKVGKGTTFYIALRLDSNYVESFVREHDPNNEALNVVDNPDNSSINDQNKLNN